MTWDIHARAPAPSQLLTQRSQVRVLPPQPTMRHIMKPWRGIPPGLFFCQKRGFANRLLTGGGRSAKRGLSRRRAGEVCGGCLRASLVWREAETYAKHLDSPLDTVLDRLRNGSQWLQKEVRRDRDDTELFLKMFETWADLEEVLRAAHGYVGCIFRTGRRCPEDAPVRCSACAARVNANGADARPGSPQKHPSCAYYNYSDNI